MAKVFFLYLYYLIFRTLKYTPAYPSQPFESIDDARQWVSQFVYWYNEEHHHSGIKFVTPAERHSGRDEYVLSQRKKVYNEAKMRHPERWSGEIRNWTIPSVVWLNPDAEEKPIFVEKIV